MFSINGFAPFGHKSLRHLAENRCAICRRRSFLHVNGPASRDRLSVSVATGILLPSYGLVAMPLDSHAAIRPVRFPRCMRFLRMLFHRRGKDLEAFMASDSEASEWEMGAVKAKRTNIAGRRCRVRNGGFSLYPFSKKKDVL